MNITTSTAMMQSIKPDPQEFARLERRARRFWVSLIVCFLGVQVIIGFVSVYLAVGDPSVAVIPNYHQSALDWDIKHRAQQLLQQLGWETTVSAGPVVAGERVLELRLVGRSGHTVEQQQVTAKVFHHARGEEIFQLKLREQEAGVYEGLLPLTRAGLWQVELTIEGDHGIASKTLDITVE